MKLFKKNEKVEEYVKKFKELWGNDFYKSLIKLGLYAIFLIFAVMAARASYSSFIDSEKSNTKKPEVNEEKVLEDFANKKEYEASFTVNNINYDFNSKGRTIIRFDNKSYFLEENKLVNTLDSTLIAPVIDFEFWHLTPYYINSLINQGNELYTKTYKAGEKEVSYLISLEEFFTSFPGSPYAITGGSLDGKNIELVITSLEEKIKIVKLDLSSYSSAIANQTSELIVNIEYK